MPRSRSSRSLRSATTLAMLLCSAAASALAHAGTVPSVNDTSPPPPGTENIEVRADGIGSATGVTNTTPGGGLMPKQTVARSQSSVTRDFIAKQAPTGNALSLVQNLPGVTFANADPLGQSDQSNVYIRGLSQTAIGFTFEGVPTADPSSYAPISSEIVDTENVGRVDVSQGHADITTPVYNAVGGEIKETLIDPRDMAGARVGVSYGSRQLSREFLRLDTGDIGNSGVKAFASFSYQDNKVWVGPGRNKRSHVDAKVMKDWGDDSSAAVFFSFTQQSNPFLVNPTLSAWNQKGRSSAYYDPTYKPGDVNFYQLNSEEHYSMVIGAPVKLGLAHTVSLAIEPYLVHLHGAGNDGQTQNEEGYNGVVPTGNLNIPGNMNGVAPVLGIDNYEQYTVGQNTVLTWKRGNNQLDTGYWYNFYNQAEKAPMAALGSNGLATNFWGSYPILTTSGVPLEQFNIHLIQQLNSLFVSDTYNALNNTLHLNAGLKYVMVNYRSTNLIPGDSYNYGRSDAKPLPQASASYDITPYDQIYTDAATAFREPSGILVYGNYWDANSPTIDLQHATNQKSEYSISEEIGFRHRGLINVSAALFNYNMTNRQLSTTSYVGNRLFSTSINAGGQTSRGAQLELGLRPWHYFSPYLSMQYLHATIDNNLQVGTDYLPTTGKTAVASPKLSGALGLSYDDGKYFANAILNYTGSQYSTFMNDEQIPGYVTANMTLGYRLKALSIAKFPQLQLNLVNIGDAHYLSGVSGIATSAKPVTGVFGTTIQPGTPSYVVGGGFAAIVSLTTGF